MRWILAVLVVTLALGLGGCLGLTPDQLKRIDELSKKNQEYMLQLEALQSGIKDGTVTADQAIIAALKIKEAMQKNMDEIHKLREEGTSGASWLVAAAGIFGRTALHLLTKIPIGGPVGIAIQALVSLLLGGSATQKKDSPVPAAVKPSPT